MAIKDNLLNIYDKLNHERKQRTLYDRYPGLYRALVVETNDPLNMHRIRFKMPEMHNFGLLPEECPWAVSAFEHGGKGMGSWAAPKIGDVVWISFEKQHAYGPIWMGHAEPTRRRFYKLHALYQKTQVYVDEEGKPVATDPIDWEEYYPQDGRPYSLGMKDRYGSMMVIDETGFFPSEHSVAPPPAGTDALTNSNFTEQKNLPVANTPDRKMMAMVTKYGHYMIMGDQGYKWENDFSGNFDNDHDLEKARQNNLIRTLNEDEPNSGQRDQRRMEFRSSYGHKFEMRDVGWASPTTGSRSRADDWFQSSSSQSDGGGNRDERWFKLRTKAGHLIQMMDMGANPSSDVMIRRNRIEEIGGKVDDEDDHWQGRDARQIRFVSRYGFKWVIDDRGSSPNDAEGLETPRGNGWLMKGRKDNRGFGWEVNEKDSLDRSLHYSHKSKIIEINDRFDYMMMCTDTNTPISETWEKLKENEFARAIAMTFDPEKDTYHCKLDLANNYLRLKTPSEGGQNQGLEVRNQGSGNTVWAELMDRDNRAIIMNSTLSHTAWHDGKETKFVLIDDRGNTILIRNKQGRTVVHSAQNIEFKSDANIIFEAAGGFNIKSGAPMLVNAAGGSFTVNGSGIATEGVMAAAISSAFHAGCYPGPGAGPSTPIPASPSPFVSPDEPNLTPNDRAAVYNSPYTKVPQSDITG